LETRIAELTSMTAELSAAEAINSIATSIEASDAAHVNGTASAQTRDEIPTDILIVISAAVTSFLGKTVRIRSAKMLQSPYEIVNPWAQQGRATMQASHSLRSWSR
jgi:hypothetical protein